MTIQLSPSTLSLFRECPRCFWLHINERIHRPRGIFPTLPSGMDNAIKAYFDKYREQHSLPPEIDGKVSGNLMADMAILNKWRDWRTGLRFYDKSRDALLRGALDDCLVDSGYYVPIDYKTRGYAPRKEDIKEYYTLQLNCYSLLLRENGYETKDLAYLIFYYPKSVSERGIVEFFVDTIQLETDTEMARITFNRAIDLLKSPVPARHSNCEYCLWLESRMDFD